MAIKFESVFVIPKRQLLLAAKAAVFGISLWLLAKGGFGFFDLVAFWIIAAILYFKPMFNSAALLRSFIVLVILSPIAVSTLDAGARYPFFFAVLLAVLFFVLLLIKQNLVVDKVSWHYFLLLSLFYTLFMLFFSASSTFILRSLLVVVAALFLLKEFWRFRSIPEAASFSLLDLVVGLSLFELLWAIGLLPLGFLNAAAAALLVLFFMLEVSHLSLAKMLHRRALLVRFCICAALLLVVFLNTSWYMP